ncbi:glycosyltransferase family 39 protein [Flavobacterium sp. 22076]|jgi:4-amino-4-deoxy-L-arabinose transferase-like glycosyltransferase|uniref:glycosyltransferase family 39 protein n=1 Tax=unclassified Flavobacterium TaxID=196869 RepID=UPI003F841F10
MKKKGIIGYISILVFSTLAYVNYKHLNIGFLSVYSIDEYAFHGSLLNMYDGLTAFDIKKIFSFWFYSYGFGFFFLNSLAVAPFIASGNIEMSIYIPRIITSFFAVGTFWYIYKIARLYSDKYFSLLLSVVVLTMPGFWKNAMWFHPDWMMTFFIILSIYLFAKDDWDFKKYFWRAGVAFGLALGTKIQAVTFLPLVFMYVFYDNFKFRNFYEIKVKVKFFSKFVIVGMLTFLFSNPYLIHPSGLKLFTSNFVSNMKSNATNHGLNVKVTIFEKIYNAIDFYYLNIFVFAFVFIFSFYLVLLIFKKEDKKSIINLISFYFAINILYLFLMVNKDWQHYYLTIFIAVPLLLLFFVDKFSKYKYYLVIGIILFQISSHISNYQEAFTTGYHPEYEMTDRKQKEMSDLLVKDLKPVITDKTNILISPFTPFDYSKLGLNYSNVNIIYGPISEEMFVYNDQLQNKQIDFIILSKNDVYFDKGKLSKRVDTKEYNKSLQIIENFNKGNNYGYQKFGDNKNFYIWRKKQ